MQNKMTDGKKARIIVAAIVIAIAVVMAIVSINILPAEVATQFEGFLNTGAPAAPKWLAVFLPFALTTLFAVRSVSEPKSIFLSLFGYVINILFWASN